MNRFGMRLLAMALTLCMVLALMPAALAAGNAAINAAIGEANEDNNFDYSYGDVVTVDAGAPGATFTKTFSRPADAKSGAVYAAILPVDADGKALDGMDVRYARLDSSNTLRYFRTDCQYFQVQLVQPAPDAGNGVLSVTRTAQGNAAALRCTAAVTLSRDVAQLVSTYAARPELEEAVFVCHIRYNTDLVALDAANMVLDSDIFDIASVTVSADGHGYDIACELQADWRNTAYQQSLLQKLQQQMTFTATATLTAADEAALAKAGVKELCATGWAMVSDLNENAVGSAALQLPMELCALPLGEIVVVDPADTGVAALLETVEHRVFMSGYEDGTFRPDRPIKRGEVAKMFYNLLVNQTVEPTVSFVDVTADDWYYTEVNALASMGILTGVGDGTHFEPERSITRAEFATIAARFATAAQGDKTFVDVPAGYWAAAHISTAAAYGWIGGVGGNCFEPDRSITRAEAVTIVNRMLGRAADETALNAGMGRSFTDVPAAHWAWEQISEAATAHTYTVVDGVEIWAK